MLPDLPTTWFSLTVFLFAGYAVLEGSDLGVGALHILVRRNIERKFLFKVMGTPWNGNKLWLVLGCAATYVAFPDAAICMFTTFKTIIGIFVGMILLRTIAATLVYKREESLWRGSLGMVFGWSSIIATFLLGVVMGNIIRGVAINYRHEYIGTFADLFHPYALLTGVLTLALFLMHGAVYLDFKTHGHLQSRMRKWVWNAIRFFIACYVLTTVVTPIHVERMVYRFHDYPWLLALPFLTLLVIANIPNCLFRGKDRAAFLCSSAAVLGFMVLFAVGVFPILVLSNIEFEYSLTAYNAAANADTLKHMLIYAVVAIGLLIGYTVFIQRFSRGEVRI